MYKKRKWGVAILVCSMLLVIGCGGDKKETVNTATSKKQDSKKTSEPAQSALPQETQAGGEQGGMEEDTQVLQDSKDTEEEASIRNEIASKLPFTAGDDKVCAVVYLGRSQSVQEEQLNHFFGRYIPDYTEAQIAQIPRVRVEGEEAYLIVPRYEACELSVNVLEKEADGTVTVHMDAEKPDGAFILYCNPSGTFANAEINIAYGARVHVIMPKISSVDQRMEMMQVALDLTDESVYE